MAEWGNLVLLRPQFLWVLPAVVLYIGLLRYHKFAVRYQRFIAPHLLQHLVTAAGSRSPFNPSSVALLVFLLVLLAALGPGWRQASGSESLQDGRVTLVVDLSESMLQEDVRPSRLQRAKQKIQDLMARSPGASFSLWVVAGSAHSALPMTDDQRIVEQYLLELEPQIMPRPGRDFSGLADLAATQSPGSLVLLTGSLLASDTAALNQLVEQGWPLHVLILAAQPGQAGGADFAYYKHSAGDADIQSLHRALAADQRRAAFADGSAEVIDLGYYLVWPMLLMLVLWWRRGWTLPLCWLLLAGAGLLPSQHARADVLDWWLTADQQGRVYFEQGDYQRAAQLFEDAEWRALALYHSGRFAEAEQLFADMDTPRGQFNLAMSLAQQQRYPAAVAALDRALVMQPQFVEAGENRAALQKLIDEINQFSESQYAEEAPSAEISGKGADKAQGKEIEVEKKSAAKYSAEDLLNEKINQVWMKQVRHSAGEFLQRKFAFQLEERQASDE